MHRLTTPRALAALLAAAVVGACGTSVPSASPPPTAATTEAARTATPATPAPSARPIAEVYAEIRTQVAGIRGLEPKLAVEPVVIDAAQLARNLEAEFDATRSADDLRDAEDVLITLGLLPAGTSLRAATLAFQSGQVAGYYSPEQDKLFVVSRTSTVGAVDEAVYAHEFTHQLQDQRFDLDALGMAVVDQSDRSLARLALVEGDATSAQTTWMTQFLSSQELGEVFAAGLDPEALAAFNNAPPYLRETALFPYQQGLAFVMRLVNQGGYAAVDAVFADPPDSTEQVLHPDKYVEREDPIKVLIPGDVPSQLGAGWTEVGQDTLGEELIRIWLKIGGIAAIDATQAAAGWGGDRLAVYRNSDGKVAIGWVTTWDTNADASEFGLFAGPALANLGIANVTRIVEGRTVIISIGAPADALDDALAAAAVVGG